MRYFSLALILAVCTICATANEKVLLKGINRFSKRLTKYAATKGRTNDNVIVSPVTAYSILTLLTNGADGETAVKLSDALGLPADDVNDVFPSLVNDLKNKSTYSKVANKIYVSNKVNIDADFKQLASKSFGCEVASLNVDNPSEAVKKINEAVEKETNGTITEVLETSDIKSDTSLVLSNAHYYKVRWGTEFTRFLTKKQGFERMNGEIVTVTAIWTNGKYLHGMVADPNTQFDNSYFVEIPLENPDLSMIIVVGKHTVDYVKTIVKNLKKINITQYGKMKSVNVILPRLNLDVNVDLKPALEGLGLTDVFSTSADLSGVADKPVKIDKIQQRIVLQIDEEGNEDKSTLQDDFSDLWGPAPAELDATQTFYFEIRNNKKNVILFSGIIDNPK